MSYHCDAHEYSQCIGYCNAVDVIFKYHDSKGRVQPDEIIQIDLCKLHHSWLKYTHQNKPLEMRGDVATYALHDDLFSIFNNKETMYTVVKVETYVNDITEETYVCVNGRDIKKFTALLHADDTDKKIIWAREEGFFQTCLHEVEGSEEFVQAVIEVNIIFGELALEAMANKLVTFYKPKPDGEMKNITPDAMTWVPRTKEKLSLETEYTLEPIPQFIREHFGIKQRQEQYDQFISCIEFIVDEIDRSVVNWDKLRENSPHTETGLFQVFKKLTDALITADKNTIDELESAGDITADVLWVTYISANHYLYQSKDKKKDLQKSQMLVDLFIAQGLEKDLLVLAISGERMRMLTISQRDHHDILYENEFVVEQLLPKHVDCDAIIYKDEFISLNALEYWKYFNNTTTYIGNGFMNRDCNETFDKNEKIREYLTANVVVV
jgi:hypothetical protein